MLTHQQFGYKQGTWPYNYVEELEWDTTGKLYSLTADSDGRLGFEVQIRDMNGALVFWKWYEEDDTTLQQVIKEASEKGLTNSAAQTCSPTLEMLTARVNAFSYHLRLLEALYEKVYGGIGLYRDRGDYSAFNGTQAKPFAEYLDSKSQELYHLRQILEDATYGEGLKRTRDIIGWKWVWQYNREAEVTLGLILNDSGHLEATEQMIEEGHKLRKEYRQVKQQRKNK